MNFIQPCILDRDKDDIYLPVLGDEYLKAKFFWKIDESFHDFSKKYCWEGLPNMYDHKFFKSKFSEDFLEICSWEVMDEEKQKFYLISFDECIEWECLHHCFCIPFHKYNLKELYNHYLNNYNFSDEREEF